MAFPVVVTLTIPQPSSVATGQPAPCYSNSVSSYMPNVQPSSASYPSWHSSSGDATWWYPRPSASRLPGNHTTEYVYVRMYQTDHTAVAVLGSLLGLAILYILISSFVRPKFFANFFAKMKDRCAYCQRDMSPDLEAAQYSEASLDAKGKGVVLFEDQDRSSVEAELKDSDDDGKDDVTAPLLGSKY